MSTGEKVRALVTVHRIAVGTSFVAYLSKKSAAVNGINGGS